MSKKYVMALDAGTSSSRAILFDRAGQIISVAAQEFPQIYPKPGWVEHNPMDIWNTQLAMARLALKKAGAAPDQISAIGITNQRETSVVWDKSSGKPVMNAIVWQDRRSSSICDDMKERGLAEYVKANTGLVVDAYFSGTKNKWMLDNLPGVRERAEKGELLFGTVDTWLIWNMTGGKAHVTDLSNASRTMLFNIKALDWDEKMLGELGIPRPLLPKLCESSQVYGMTDPSLFDGVSIPVAASVGDQQGALFGQACFREGMVKATYGTGGSLQMNTGPVPIRSENGMLTSVAWSVGGKVQYALEGLLYVLGAAVQWLRDELRLIDSSEDSDYFARKVPDTNGVYVVPAFVGIPAPHWDQYARGAILGLTRGANRYHIIRATLESIAYQIRDVIECMEKDAGIATRELKVDGGAAKNEFLMQFQADLLGIPILRPKVVETTARGAAFLAGLATGFWRGQDELLDAFELDRVFKPERAKADMDRLYTGWNKAVRRAMDWEEH
jgi:glycerol kinase